MEKEENSGEKVISFKEQRVRKVTHLYYSRPEVQRAIFDFSRNREICPRYFEGFGKRPDSFEYPGDVFGLVKKGATSFHCSEELWKNPLEVATGMGAKELNDLREGWDLLIDIDCKWFDYSKLAARAIIEVLEKNGVKNIGLKFSGSKGWHIFVPWKAFPAEVGGEKTKNLFPELPRKIVAYLRSESEKQIKEHLPEDFEKQFKNVKIKRGIKCKLCSGIADSFNSVDLYCDFCRQGEQRKLALDKSSEKYKCPGCKRNFEIVNSKEIFECKNCGISSEDNPRNFSESIEVDLFELMGLDIVLVSPRHLFRMPYSLHEKTALASVVLEENELESFELKDADAMKASIKNFMPDSEKGEARDLVRNALDWYDVNKINQGEVEEKITGKYADFKPIVLDSISDDLFPPCVKKIFEGMADGKKRAVFVLINLFRSLGMDKEQLEKRIYEWNEKNNPQLRKGYIKSQLIWAYKRKPIMPQNCKEFYQGIGVCLPDVLCGAIKNPVNYAIKKSFMKRGKGKKKAPAKKAVKKNVDAKEETKKPQ